MAAGRPACEPVAIVRRAGHADSETAVTTLAMLREDGCDLPAPVVIVVGAVVGLSSSRRFDDADVAWDEASASWLPSSATARSAS